MRTTHTCPRCQHDRVLLIDEVSERGDMNALRPLSIATAVVGKTFMGDEKLGLVGETLGGVGPDELRSSGGAASPVWMSAAVCRKCGYTELYVKDPASIPVDGVRVREAVAKKK